MLLRGIMPSETDVAPEGYDWEVICVGMRCKSLGRARLRASLVLINVFLLQQITCFQSGLAKLHEKLHHF